MANRQSRNTLRKRTSVACLGVVCLSSLWGMANAETEGLLPTATDETSPPPFLFSEVEVSPEREDHALESTHGESSMTGADSGLPKRNLPTILAGAGSAPMTPRSSATIIIDDDEGPSAPTIASLTPEDGKLTVAWTAPTGSNESISEYQIRYRPAHPAPGWRTLTRMRHESGGILQRDITGLTNRVEYDVQVRAVTAAANGTWSATAKSTPRTCPDGIELDDCRTLLAIRDTLVGDGTALNWEISLPIHEWTGVKVNFYTRRVVEIDLYNLGLSGTIPPRLGNLAMLQSLFVGQNGLTGTIPAELGRIPALQYLSLRHNELTGPIPPELSHLPNLDWLLLDGNKLTGPIPAELGNLPNLVTLWLYDNELTDSIPSTLGRLRKLDQLVLDRNQLTGSIPRELGRLTNLTALSLARNHLTGCVPLSLLAVRNNDLDQLGLPICPAPCVTGLALESSPLDGQAYGTGEQIDASVWFDTNVTVVGSPQLALMIGSGVRAAQFVADRGNGRFGFRYVVAPGDRDSDGVGIAPDALSLNGGSIRSVDREDAVLGLGEHAFANHPSHRVRGALRELVPDQELEAQGDALTLELSRYFDVPEGGTLTYGAPVSSDPAVAGAIIEDRMLIITPRDEGAATINITATDDNGVTVTLSFRAVVTMRGLRPWLMGVLAEGESGQTETSDSQ